jgi:hypothetical protein
MKKIVSLSSAISDFLKDYDKELWAELMISQNWSKIGGRRKFNSLKIRKGTLKISTYDSTLRNFLLNQKNMILERINKEILGENLVSDIQIFSLEVPIFKRFSTKIRTSDSERVKGQKDKNK